MDLININLIKLDADLKTKDEAIVFLSKLINEDGRLNDYYEFLQSVYARELEISTNLGEGIAMPHGKSNAVKESSLALAVLKKAIPWGPATEPVKMVFQIAVPDNSDNLHLKILATLSRKLIYDDFKAQLYNAKSNQEILDVLNNVVGGLS